MHCDKLLIEITNEIWYENILVSVPCQKPVPRHRPLSIVVCLICYLEWFFSVCTLSNNVEGYSNDIVCSLWYVIPLEMAVTWLS
jgi:hypothetical protein